MGRILVLRSILLVVALVLLGALATGLGLTEGWSRAVLLFSAGCMLVPKAGLCEWLFQGRNEMASVMITMLLEPLLALAGTLAFVRTPEDLGRVPFILAAGIAAVAVAQQALARARGVRPDLVHGVESAGAHWREALPLSLSTLAWALRIYAPMVAMGLFAAGPGAGTFGAAHRLTVSMHAVVWLWFFNALPTWSSLAKEPGTLEKAVRRSTLATLGLAALLGVAVTLFGRFVVRLLYGDGYQESGELLGWIVLVPAIAWVSGNFRFGLIAMGALWAELAASAAGAAMAIGSLFVMRASLDPWRAGVVFCAAEAVTLLVAAAMWRRKAGAGPPAR
jgi:O-antigen/teichoic acid export membrane protein